MRLKFFLPFFLFTVLTVFGQQKEGSYTSIIRDDSGNPLTNVTVRVRGTGQSVLTNGIGEFTVNASAGDVLIISKDGKRINTVTLNNSNFYKVNDKSEELKRNKKSSSERKIYKNRSQNFEAKIMLDSARYYKISNPDKSIGFVEKALKGLSPKSDSKDMSIAYSILGDVYSYIKQYDLAVSNYEVALNYDNQNSIKFKLANAYTLNTNFDESTEMYNELLKDKISTNQKVLVYEGLGDNASWKLGKLDQAIESGDWAAVERQANKILDTVSTDGSEKFQDSGLSVSSYDNSRDDNSRAGWESSGGQSTTTVDDSIDDERISMLEKLIETDDWQGIVTSARIYNKDDSTNASESIQGDRMSVVTGDSSTLGDIPSKTSSQEETKAEGQVWKALTEEAAEENDNDKKPKAL